MFCKNCGQQIEKGHKFCKSCGTEAIKPETLLYSSVEWTKKNKKGLIIAGIIIIFVGWVVSSDSGSNTTPQDQSSSVQAAPANETTNQDQIAASVVNILCPDGDNSSGGSGTIMGSKGVILTNAHIIPQDDYGNPTVETCIVTLPDEQGKIKEVYYGEPILISDLSTKYDLAFIKINGVYVDEDGKSYGHYPNYFPSYFDTGCGNDNPRLGEKVRVFGYPAISGGGYFLTITDGLVSSLPNDGTIVTSAKIDHGSSGGLAVDENGCMIGIPSMISGDGNETLGVLISNDVISEFMTKLSTIMNNS